MSYGDDGIVFEEALFRKGEGTVTLTDGRVKAGQRPELSGKVKVTRVELTGLLPAVVTDYLEGSISGDFRLFGSTNSSEGVGFEGDVELGEGDKVTLRDEFPILKALSVVDAFNNYRRVDFTERFAKCSHAWR